MSDLWPSAFFALALETSALQLIHSPPPLRLPTVIMADRYTHDHPPPGRVDFHPTFFHPSVPSPPRSVPGTTFLFRCMKRKKINKIKDQRTFQTFVLATLLEFLILKEGINKGRIVKTKRIETLKASFQSGKLGKRKEGRKEEARCGETQCRWQVAPRQPAADARTTSN